MDVGLLFVTLLLIFKAELKYINLCKLEYRTNCRYRYDWGCKISLYYCNKAIKCDERTTINIKTAYYGTNNFYVKSEHCPHGCYSGFRYSQNVTIGLMTLCNKKSVCDLSQWNTYTYWKLQVHYDCQERTSLPNTSIHWMSTPQPPQKTTSSNDTESKMDENNLPDKFPVPAVAACVSAGIIVLVIVLTVVVCIKRRRRTIKSNQPDETTLQLQIVANNSYGCSPPSVNREDHHEIDEHAYVDINLQNASHAADGTSEQEYVYINVDKVVTTDINDEYSTLNTYPAPLRVDPNYVHIPKGSHTTVDETYSHITDGQTTMPNATYLHLKDTKSAASRISQINQNNSDNVYNHINTKSVEENVYNNSQTSFNTSSLSHLGETKAVKIDYDHTDWKQTNTSNSKSKHSNNEAVGKFKTNNITERAHDEYAVVNKRSDKVEGSDGHNYFELEKQFFKRK